MRPVLANLSRRFVRMGPQGAGQATKMVNQVAVSCLYVVLAEMALSELRRTQPNISLHWIATQLPWANEADREHYLEGFRRAGLR